MFFLPPLPYKKNALEPYMSAQTLEFHHDKHHAAYVNKTNALIEGTPFATLESLADVVMASYEKDTAIFNNAAQAWNHEFFWKLMTPGGSKKPVGELLTRIESSFGSFESFVEAFITEGIAQFGSGWVWLVASGEGLEIIKTSNANTPIVQGKTPLIACDVWEHSYYLDFQNRRPEYLKSFLEDLVNWDVVAQNLS